jgi:hypothetical protein
MIKRYILGLVVIITISSCGAPMFALGTSENEFLKEARKFRNKSIRVESNSPELTIYKYGYEGSGGVTYYYFQNGLLRQVNTGVLVPNIRIEQNVYHH